MSSEEKTPYQSLYEEKMVTYRQELDQYILKKSQKFLPVIQIKDPGSVKSTSAVVTDRRHRLETDEIKECLRTAD